jgi:hypothetical protein
MWRPLSRPRASPFLCARGASRAPGGLVSHFMVAVFCRNIEWQAIAKAHQLSLRAMRPAIVRDLQFWGPCRLETKLTDADLSEFHEPNLMAGHGVRVWATA